VVQEMALQAAQHAVVSVLTAMATSVGAGIVGPVTEAIARDLTGMQTGIVVEIVAMAKVMVSMGVVISNKATLLTIFQPQHS
jgi:hypothetical protein